MKPFESLQAALNFLGTLPKRARRVCLLYTSGSAWDCKCPGDRVLWKLEGSLNGNVLFNLMTGAKEFWAGEGRRP